MPFAVLAASVAMAVVWRLPFLRYPITDDEAGYALVARFWSHGSELYGGAWVDRPQGLVLIFRLVLAFSGSVTALRIAALITSLVLLVLLGLLARELESPRFAAIAVVLLGFFGASPLIESFTLSGELLASVFVTASLLCFVRGPEQTAWIAAAGLLSGCALMIKQSGLDAELVVPTLLILSGSSRRYTRAAVFVGASTLPVLAAAASATNFHRWWFAVVGYRAAGDSLITGSPVHRLLQFVLTSPALLLGLTPLLALGLYGWKRSPTLVRVWLAAAGLGVVGGGNFHAHYYIQLVPPLTLLASYGVLALRHQPVVRYVPVFAAVALFLVASIHASTGGEAQQVRSVSPVYLHTLGDRVAATYARNHLAPNQRLLVIPPVPAIYFLAGRSPAFRYLWPRPAETVPGAAAELDHVLATQSAALILDYGQIGRFDRSGRAQRLLRSNYYEVTRIPGVGGIEGPTVLAPRK
jgi:hypothetical protein